MQKLVFMFWGTVLLMYLSQKYYPAEHQLQHQTDRNHFLSKKSDYFSAIVIFWLSAFSFLRVSYNDTATYIGTFNSAQSLTEGFATGTFTDWTGNPWSMLYRSLIREVTDNYHIYFLFPAVLSSFAAVKLFKKYSVNPAFSLIIFFSLGTYIMYMAALKQCLAIFCLLFAVPFALDGKYVKFYLLVLAAIFFHTHSFMFAIVPFLLTKPWGKTTWLLLGATLFAAATYNSTLGAFMEYAQSIGALVDEGELFDGHSINVLRVLVYWVPALLALLFRQRLFTDSTKTENLFVNMSIVSAFILTLGLVQAANLFARMAGYFEIATAVALPWMIKKIFTKESAHMVTGLAVVLYFGYFMFEFTVSKDFNNEYAAITMWQFIQSLFG